MNGRHEDFSSNRLVRNCRCIMLTRRLHRYWASRRHVLYNWRSTVGTGAKTVTKIFKLLVKHCSKLTSEF